MLFYRSKLKLLISTASILIFLSACDSETNIDTFADSIYSGGTIITMVDSKLYAEALAVKDGKILAVGHHTDVIRYKGASTKLIRLKGNTLLPGFIDAHGHFSLVGVLAQSANLAAAPEGAINNVGDIIQTLKAHVNSPQAKELGWLIGMNYDDSQLTHKQHPTAIDLDKVSTEIPILIIHQSAHLGVLNSKGLQLLGIDETTVNPPAGIIRRITNTNKPNGVLEESILFKVALGIIKPKSAKSFFALMKDAQQQYKKAGFTTIQEGRATAENIKGLVAASIANLLDIDVVAYPSPDFFESDEAFTELMKTQPHHYTNRYRIGGFKLSLDGSPQGKTAWLTKPYFKSPQGKDSNYTGYPAMSLQNLNKYTQLAFENNWQLLTHSNGDAATDQYIKAISKAKKLYPEVDIRPVLIHAQVIREDQLDALKQLKVIPSFMTVHSFYWGDWHRDSVLGKQRAKRISPTKSSLDKGILYTAHNDAPVTLPNAMMILSSQVNRISRSGKIIGKEQRVSVLEALKSITINAAYQYFEEKTKGSLEVGKVADFVILDQNPLKIEPMKLNHIKILETIKNNKTVYKKIITVI